MGRASQQATSTRTWHSVVPPGQVLPWAPTHLTSFHLLSGSVCWAGRSQETGAGRSCGHLTLPLPRCCSKSFSGKAQQLHEVAAAPDPHLSHEALGFLEISNLPKSSQLVSAEILMGAV